MAVIPSQDQELGTMPNQFTLHICSETLSTNTFVLKTLIKLRALTIASGLFPCLTVNFNFVRPLRVCQYIIAVILMVRDRL